jgi:hypothetical protein
MERCEGAQYLASGEHPFYFNNCSDSLGAYDDEIAIAEYSRILCNIVHQYVALARHRERALVEWIMKPTSTRRLCIGVRKHDKTRANLYRARKKASYGVR